jgi:drug/metabolite transporter (DMT)-like permease
MMPAVSASSHDPRPVITAVGLKLVSVLGLAAMAACVKALGSAVPPGQVVFFRGLISMLVIAGVASRLGGLRLLATSNWRAHAARSHAGSLSMFCWFFTLTLIPLAEMTAISFTVPLFLTLLALVFLGERIHVYRWTALGVGFAGVLVIVGPDMLTSQSSVLGKGIGLVAAVFAALALMFLRHMSAREHALAITFYFFLTSSALAFLTIPFAPWPLPTGGQWLLLGMTGIFGVLGQLAMTWSYRYAEASLLAPLDYLSMIVALAIGYYVFDEVPGISTWVGAPLVIAAGAIILWREYATLPDRPKKGSDPFFPGGNGA